MYDKQRKELKQDYKKLQGHNTRSGSDLSINKLYDLLDAILDAKIEELVLHEQALTFLLEDNKGTRGRIPVLFFVISGHLVFNSRRCRSGKVT